MTKIRIDPFRTIAMVIHDFQKKNQKQHVESAIVDWHTYNRNSLDSIQYTIQDNPELRQRRDLQNKAELWLLK